MAVGHSPIVGIFDERGAAEGAIEQLHNAGFNDDQICYSGNVSANTGDSSFLETIKRFFTGNQTTQPSDVAHELSNMGLPDDEADYYAQEYDAGRSIVAVNPGERYGDALTILRLNGAYSYRSGGSYNQVGTPPATGYDQAAAGATPDNPQQSDYATQPDYNQVTGNNPQTANYNQVAGSAGPTPDSPQPPQTDYAAQSGYNVSGGYNPQAAGYNEQPPNYEQGANAASYNQQAAGSAYNPQAAGYNEQPPNYEQGANAAPYNQQAAGAGYDQQAAGYNEQLPNYEQGANAASYNQQAAGSAYNPQAAGYNQQPQSYGQGSVNPDSDEARNRRLREERRDDAVTDADTNP
jgi:hypothetical protein